MALKITLLLILIGQVFGFVHGSKYEKDARLQASLSQILMQPKPFQLIESNDSVVTLFTIHGSNTIGASLGPKLAMSYLAAKGAVNVRNQPTLIENEKIIKGDLFAQGKTIQIKIEAHGSSTGFKGLENSDAEIWASSRPVKDKEVSKLIKQYDLRSHKSEHILGIDGLAIVVNISNPIKSLSKLQLGQVFSGEVINWSQLGGLDQPINLYARDQNSGTWDSFKNMVLSKTLKLSDNAQRFESSSALANRVTADVGGIGFIGMAFVGGNKLLAISDGPAQAFKPSEMTVATEDYALSRRLFFYTKSVTNNQYVNEFMNYAQGVHGQNIVKTEGVVSQNVISTGMELDKSLPKDYLELVKGAKRLSINFRFKEGSAMLDNKSKIDILRLVYFLKEQGEGSDLSDDIEQPKVMLIGFGDKRKNAQRSKLLSKLRAMAVRRELGRLGIHPKVTTGYGDFNPVAGFLGKSGLKNRRVEVWVR
jgi:phosphate transport system substrate-binding protein